MISSAAKVPETADREDVREELRRIFDASQFNHSPVMCRLLSFLVEQTLAGKGDRLKAYTIAVDALDRDTDFDPRIDSYPRVQVGRLRKLLDDFYGEKGSITGLRIHIPKGAYIVRFSMPKNAIGEMATSFSKPPSRPVLSNTTIANLGRFAAAGFIAVLIGLFAWQALSGLARADTDEPQSIATMAIREQSQEFMRCIKVLAEDQCRTMFGTAGDPSLR